MTQPLNDFFHNRLSLRALFETFLTIVRLGASNPCLAGAASVSVRVAFPSTSTEGHPQLSGSKRLSVSAGRRQRAQGRMVVEFVEEMDPRSGRIRAANVRPI
jgi:hypothetical protein